VLEKILLRRIFGPEREMKYNIIEKIALWGA
jgi:hypothetical protein